MEVLFDDRLLFRQYFPCPLAMGTFSSEYEAGQLKEGASYFLASMTEEEEGASVN